MHTPLSTINGKHTTPMIIGGGMHNDYINGSDMVSFKAVQVKQEKLCHIGSIQS